MKKAFLLACFLAAMLCLPPHLMANAAEPSAEIKTTENTVLPEKIDAEAQKAETEKSALPQEAAPKDIAQEKTTEESEKTAQAKELAEETRQNSNVESSEAKIREEIAEKVDEAAVEDIGLVLQNILLSQGEDGNELWRLNASYASISTEEDKTSVEKPVVQYTLGDPAEKDYIDVTADTGHITEKQRFLLLEGNVEVRRADQYIKAPMMRYDAQERLMIFPEGAHVESPNGEGFAKYLTWHLDKNILQAKNRVDIVIKAAQKP